MDNVNTLLVAFMFITILTLGIASTLGELAEVVRNAGKVRKDGLLVGWTALLLFAYFNLFWHTADITLLEDWSFWLFLFAETGPVILLFATQIVLGALAEEAGESTMTWRQVRFFLIFALLQAWSIAAGFVLGVGLTIGSVNDLVILVTCLVLAGSTKRTVHVTGLVVVWVTLVAGTFVDVRPA